MAEKVRRSEIIKAVVFYTVFFLFIVVFSTAAKNYDYDFWARLIAGMGFVQSGHVLKHDFLSYTPTHQWIDHEWGSGVIFYLILKFLGPAGILILQTMLVFLTFFFVSKIVKLRGVKTTSAYNFLFYYFAFMAINYIMEQPIRCQLFSFLFFTVFLYILELARSGKEKPLWLMPPLMIVWCNLHGGCISGIGLIILYIIGEFLNKKTVKKYIYVLIPTVLALLINPWGWNYLEFLFMANTMRRVNIVEWQGIFSEPFIHQLQKSIIYMFALLLIESGVIIKQSVSKTFNFDKTKILVLAVTLYLGIQHVKLLPFSIITMACFLYDDFYTAFNFLTRDFFNKIANVKDTVIYLLILIFALSNINKKFFEPRLNFSTYPVLPVEFLKINGIQGNLLINFTYGSYASYKLYPQNKIYVDGRYEEVYYDDLLILLDKFYSLYGNWDDLLKKYPPDIIILEKKYPVCAVLEKQTEWTSIFEDNNFIVFVKLKNAQKKYKKPSLDLNHYKKTLFDTDINFMLKSKNE